MRGVRFEIVSVKEDGQAHRLVLQGDLPDGTEVRLEGTVTATEAGTHTARAIFTNSADDANCEAIADDGDA